jgi:hypothetical protein
MIGLSMQSTDGDVGVGRLGLSELNDRFPATTCVDSTDDNTINDIYAPSPKDNQARKDVYRFCLFCFCVVFLLCVCVVCFQLTYLL